MHIGESSNILIDQISRWSEIEGLTEQFGNFTMRPTYPHRCILSYRTYANNRLVNNMMCLDTKYLYKFHLIETF